MGIDGRVVRQTVVDDVSEVVDIESAGCDVCSDEHRHHTVAELLHHDVSLLLRKITVKGLGIVTVSDKFIGHFLCVAASAAEDNRIYIRRIVGDTFQRKIFIAGVDHIVDMFDVCRAFIACADDDFLGVFHEAFGDTADLGRHCRREQKHLSVFGHMAENICDRIHKAHVEHLVCFVEHNGVHIVEFYHSAIDQVDQSAGRGDYDLNALTE